MSHFTVLCLGDNVEEQLEPFCELECSFNQEEIKNDHRSEFVQEYTTEELIKDFEEIKNNHPEYYYENLEEFAKEYHGFSKLENEELWGRWTNPNSKWDWYQIGGRWSGFFKIKDNPKYPDDILTGSPGLMTPAAKPGYADSIRLCDIDFEGMKKEKIEQAEKNWEAAENEIDKSMLYWKYGIEKDQTKENYIINQSKFSTYALLKDGEWFAKGEMGWWAISTNENENWGAQIERLISTLPEDTLLTVVDCHI